MRLWDTYYTATSLEDAVKLLGEYRDVRGSLRGAPI